MQTKWKRSERVQIAVQKSGRLADHSMALLKRCGLRLTRGTDELLAVAENMPVDVLLVRDDEIPGLLRDEACDLGIVGFNVAEEQRLALDPEQPAPGLARLLDFGGCRLSMAYPGDSEAKTVRDIEGLRVATSYPRLTGRFLDEAGVSAHIIPFSGAVELAPRLGRAEAICDLVSSGKTLAANQLNEGETVLESRAALLLTPGKLPAPRQQWVDLLKRRIEGVMQARETKYIMLHAPRAALHRIAELLPGSEAPTIMPLEGRDDRVAMHAVCRESVFWETLEALKDAGASSVLVLPVEKMLE